MPLTEIKIKSAKPKSKPYKLSDAEGMFLLVHPNGSKYWRLKYRVMGKEKLLSLGVYPEVSLSEAREKRIEARKTLKGGVDPSQHKKEGKRQAKRNAQNTFEAIAREWHHANLAKWTPKHGAKILGSVDIYFNHWSVAA